MRRATTLTATHSSPSHTVGRPEKAKSQLSLDPRNTTTAITPMESSNHRRPTWNSAKANPQKPMKLRHPTATSAGGRRRGPDSTP